MGVPIKSYEELRVYEVAFAGAMEIYWLSKSWPSQEKFSLIDQIRRSSRSVCGNIAEACESGAIPLILSVN
jgi:four helix bundle protein